MLVAVKFFVNIRAAEPEISAEINDAAALLEKRRRKLRRNSVRQRQENHFRREPAGLLSPLHALISKSLVRTESLPSGEQRFLLLETIREFALEQVRAQGEEARLRQRHFAAYLQLIRIGDRQMRGPDATTW